MGSVNVGPVHAIDSIDTCPTMREPPPEKRWLQLLKAVRFVIVIPILMTVALVALAGYVATLALHLKYPTAVVTAVFSLASVIFTRLIWLIINGCIQAVTASAMIAEKPNGGKNGSVKRRQVSIATLISEIWLPRT